MRRLVKFSEVPRVFFISEIANMETQLWLVFFFTFIFFIRNVKSANATIMFVFGDSYADTGNHNKSMASWKFPYGITFPGRPSGRYSNGRVLTDFVASYFNMNSAVPYELRNDYDPSIIAEGINFAYGGTGVFNTSNGLPNLGFQINLLEQLVQEGVFSVQDLKSSVVLVSVAGNDYNYYLKTHGSYEGVDKFVGLLIKQLSIDLERLYQLGIQKVAVTSLQPLGCLPFVTIEYSYKYCNETANQVALLHNGLLQEAIETINKNMSGVNMVVLDQYTAFNSTLLHPGNEPLLKPCCMGNITNHNCGSLDNQGNVLYNLCVNPNSAFFWDIFHPTQEAWHAMIPSFESTLNSLMSFVQIRSFV